MVKNFFRAITFCEKKMGVVAYAGKLPQPVLSIEPKCQVSVGVFRENTNYPHIIFSKAVESGVR